VRYNVAVSLDGYVAGRGGEYDWIVMDPAIDFAAIFSQFDTLVMGRRTFDVTRAQGGGSPASGMKVFVISRTLKQEDYLDVTIISTGVAERIAALKNEPGKDIWLFGGGILFRSLLNANLVDSIEIAVMPVLLSDGIPLLPPGERSAPLRLVSSTSLPSGIVMLSYEVPSR
jgi:dihydrofolate reductase